MHLFKTQIAMITLLLRSSFYAGRKCLDQVFMNLGCNHQKLDFSTLDFGLGPCSASYDVESSPLSPWDTADIQNRWGKGNGVFNFI